MFSGLTPTTEVEAVNLMLADIGEQPVASIEGNLYNADVASAHIRLRSMSRALQVMGWNFNTEEKLPLLRNINGNIILPDDIIRAVPARADPEMRFIRWTIRQQKLFDRDTNTNVWSRDVTADIMRLLPFQDLPEPARSYVTERAAVRFQKNFVGSDTLYSFTPEETAMARAVLVDYETEEGKFNMLTGSESVQDVWGDY